MKKLLIIILLCPWALVGQDCLKEYETLMDAAYQLATQKNPDYQKSLKTYTAAGIVAKDCGENKTAEINTAIRKIFDKMNQDLEAAKVAEAAAATTLATAKTATDEATAAQKEAETAEQAAQKALSALQKEQKAIEAANQITEQAIKASQQKKREIEASIQRIEQEKKRTEAAQVKNADAFVEYLGILNKIHFYGGLAIAKDKESGKYGLINRLGNLVVGFIYEEEPSYNSTTGFFETSEYYFNDREQHRVCRRSWEAGSRADQITYMDVEGETYFPRSLPKCKNLRVLACTRIQQERLYNLPNDLAHLEQILLRDCFELKELPSDIGGLKQLKILLINYNFKLKKLPESVLELTNLEELNLKGCYNFSSLPNGIENLKQLKWMNLSETKISAGKVKKLREQMPWCKIYY